MRKTAGSTIHHHDAFAPATVPVSGYIAHPIALSPNAVSNIDLGVQLHAHLEIAFEDGFWDWKRARDGGVILKTNHVVITAFFEFGGRGSDDKNIVDKLVEVDASKLMSFMTLR